MRYPLQGTAKFDEDISEVRRCIKNPSLNSGFLKMTDNSVESIYEKYLKDIVFKKDNKNDSKLLSEDNIKDLGN